MITGVLVLALGYFAYDRLVLSAVRDAALVEATTQAIKEQDVIEDTVADSGKSIAVLPFVKWSPCSLQSSNYRFRQRHR